MTRCLDSLVRRLNLGGDSAARTPEGLEITRRNGVRLETPVSMRVSETVLESHLRGMSDDAHDVFPNKPPMEAALQLLIVHIDEAIETHRDAPGGVLSLGSGYVGFPPLGLSAECE